jgi:hypothetical protein
MCQNPKSCEKKVEAFCVVKSQKSSNIEWLDACKWVITQMSNEWMNACKWVITQVSNEWMNEWLQMGYNTNVKWMNVCKWVITQMSNEWMFANGL